MPPKSLYSPWVTCNGFHARALVYCERRIIQVSQNANLVFNIRLVNEYDSGFSLHITMITKASPGAISWLFHTVKHTLRSLIDRYDPAAVRFRSNRSNNDREIHFRRSNFTNYTLPFFANAYLRFHLRRRRSNINLFQHNTMREKRICWWEY